MAKSILREFMNKDVGALGFKNGIANIHYQKIKEASKNRGLRHIQELAEDIAEDGLDDNLVVRKIEDSTYEYELVAGHRRYNAILYNIKNGDMTYEYIPCKVTTMDDIDARRRLILNNYNADPLTEAEKLDTIEELRDIYRLKKENGEKIPGRIQNLIAKDIGLKKSQVGNYEKILNNAIPEVREKIAEGMPISTAAELSSLNEEEQLMFVERKDCVDLRTIKEYKKEVEEDIFNDDPFASSDDILASINYDEEEIFNESNSINEGSSTINHNKQIENLETNKIHTHTITQSFTLIDQELNLLKQRMNEVEFREEYSTLQEFIEKFQELKKLLNL